MSGLSTQDTSLTLWEERSVSTTPSLERPGSDCKLFGVGTVFLFHISSVPTTVVTWSTTRAPRCYDKKSPLGNDRPDPVRGSSSRQNRYPRLTNLPCHGQALGIGYGGQFLITQPFNGVLVIPQVQLGAHQDDGSIRTVVPDLWVPLKQSSSLRTVRDSRGKNLAA